MLNLWDYFQNLWLFPGVFTSQLVVSVALLAMGSAAGVTSSGTVKDRKGEKGQSRRARGLAYCHLLMAHWLLRTLALAEAIFSAYLWDWKDYIVVF